MQGLETHIQLWCHRGTRKELVGLDMHPYGFKARKIGEKKSYIYITFIYIYIAFCFV